MTTWLDSWFMVIFCTDGVLGLTVRTQQKSKLDQHLFIYLFIYSFIILHYHHIIIKSLIHPLATVNDTQFFVWAPTCSYAGQTTSGHAPSEATYSWISFPPQVWTGSSQNSTGAAYYKQHKWLHQLWLFVCLCVCLGETAVVCCWFLELLVFLFLSVGLVVGVFGTIESYRSILKPHVTAFD